MHHELIEWGLLFGFIVVVVGVSTIAGAGVHALFPSISEDFGGSVAFFVIIVIVGYLLATRLRQKRETGQRRVTSPARCRWKKPGGKIRSQRDYS